jgi:hypothetical protein
MDTANNEDKIVHQIEKSLSNNINEDLFMTGRLYEDQKFPSVKSNTGLIPEDRRKSSSSKEEYPLVSNEHRMDSQVTLSRAEYIRQAREACLRQLSSSQVYSRAYDVNYMENDTPVLEVEDKNNAKEWGLFQKTKATDYPEETEQDIASFRSLMVRTVCAILLFVTIFVIDKFEIKVGNITHTMIQEHVTGNDTLQEVENWLVGWLE